MLDARAVSKRDALAASLANARANATLRPGVIQPVVVPQNQTAPASNVQPKSASGPAPVQPGNKAAPQPQGNLAAPQSRPASGSVVAPPLGRPASGSVSAAPAKAAVTPQPAPAKAGAPAKR